MATTASTASSRESSVLLLERYQWSGYTFGSPHFCLRFHFTFRSFVYARGEPFVRSRPPPVHATLSEDPFARSLASVANHGYDAARSSKATVSVMERYQSWGYTFGSLHFCLRFHFTFRSFVYARGEPFAVAVTEAPTGRFTKPDRFGTR